MLLFPTRRIGWGVTLGAVAFIYLTLSPVGSFQHWLKGHGWQTPVSEAILTISATLILYFVFVRLDRRSPSHLIAIVGVGLTYLFMMVTLAPHPSDRIHLLEYSLLTVSFFYALQFDIPRRFLYPATWLAAFGAGLIDELIQRFIPTRASDLHDAWLNGVAALVALTFIGLVLERENNK